MNTLTSSSPAKDRYITTINNLLATNVLTFNAHAMLIDLINEKEDIFFTSIMNPIDTFGNYTINHLPELLDGKMNRELELLFSQCSYEEAKAASLSDRSDNKLTHKSLTYGETSFSSFFHIMNTLKRSQQGISGGTFYDLGSGSGRAVFTTRFTQDFDRCVGLELMGNLHDLAITVKDNYEDGSFHDRLRLSSCNVESYCADILEFDWADGDVVFAHSTCFGKNLLREVFKKGANLKKGAILIMFNECCKGMEDIYELVEESKHPMTWGLSDVFFFRRK